jgi:hypothetical protein
VSEATVIWKELAEKMKRERDTATAALKEARDELDRLAKTVCRTCRRDADAEAAIGRLDTIMARGRG